MKCQLLWKLAFMFLKEYSRMFFPAARLQIELPKFDEQKYSLSAKWQKKKKERSALPRSKTIKTGELGWMFNVVITVQRTLHRVSAELRLGEGQHLEALWWVHFKGWHMRMTEMVWDGGSGSLDSQKEVGLHLSFGFTMMIYLSISKTCYSKEIRSPAWILPFISS